MQLSQLHLNHSLSWATGFYQSPIDEPPGLSWRIKAWLADEPPKGVTGPRYPQTKPEKSWSPFNRELPSV